MESIENLREYGHDCCARIDDAIKELADAIEAEVAERYVALPVDADGEYIHIGDVMDGYSKTVEVVEMRYGRSGWVLISRDGGGYADCAAFAHHHEPTVEDEWTIEDTLRELLDVHTDWLESDAPASVMKTREEIIADFAAKIRGDAE